MYNVWSCDDIASQHCKEANRCLWLNQRIAMNNDKFTLNLLYWGFIVLMLFIWLYMTEGVRGWRIDSCASDYNICWIFTVETWLFGIIQNVHTTYKYVFTKFASLSFIFFCTFRVMETPAFWGLPGMGIYRKCWSTLKEVQISTPATQ